MVESFEKPMIRRLLIFSLLLNIALVVALRPRSQKETIVAPKRSAVVLTEEVVTETNVTIKNPEPEQTSHPFSWSEIQTDDFVRYAKNLQSIGCPPQTIREILAGETGDWMTQRRRELLEPYQSQFWIFAAEGKELPESVQQEMRELKTKRQKMLGLALASVKTAEKSEDERHSYEDYAGVVSPETKVRFDEIDRKFTELRRVVSANQNLKSEERDKEISKLYQQQKAEELKLLTPEEQAEYKLRKSAASSGLQELRNFRASENELREIARIQGHLTELGDNPETRKAIKSDLENLLGNERYAEFERARDNRYELLVKIAEHYELPVDSANQAYKIQRSALEKGAEISKDKTLTPDQRAAALDELYELTQTEISKTLSGNAAKAFWKNSPLARQLNLR
jgi:hypothetical protein